MSATQLALLEVRSLLEQPGSAGHEPARTSAIRPRYGRCVGSKIEKDIPVTSGTSNIQVGTNFYE